jgi:prolyl-tRNA editing enzyme YbaK/EbsC (Cys-tRNA(Pro) deacylase)
MGSFMEELVNFLLSVKEQLRPGGRLVISCYNKEALTYSVIAPWRDASLAATLDPEREELEVTLETGGRFRVFCRAYSYGELKSHLSRIFSDVRIYTCPAFASFLPASLFDRGPRAKEARRIIETVDLELADARRMPIGAYLTAVCTKDHSSTIKKEASSIVQHRGKLELLAYLGQENIDYELREHSPVRNIKDVQRVLDIDLDGIAKTILVLDPSEDGMDHGKVYVFVVRGSRQLDLQKVGALLGRERRKWRFATQKEVKDVYGLDVGGVPPFGYKEDVMVYMDRGLAMHEMVYCGIGSSRSSIRIVTQDLIRISKAKLVDISVES